MQGTTSRTAFFGVLLATILGCGSSTGGDAGDEAPAQQGGSPPSTPSQPAPPGPADTSSGGSPAPKPGKLSLVAVTFNTGISEGVHHDAPPADGFTGNEAKKNADHYGNGLAWNAAIADAKLFFQKVAPDLVAFQEIFHPGDCPGVPADARAGFVCETWNAGDPTVVQMVVGPGYQVACHAGKPDKCLAVKKTFGTFKGCASSLCLDGLAGAAVPTCGKGSRIGRGVIEVAGGGTLTAINVHGSSGFSTDENECRKKQFEQVFVNLDGAPAATAGQRNVILGDFNTDPGRLSAVDVSAATLNAHVGGSKPFKFITEIGATVAPTYRLALVPFLPAGFNIDHVISDTLKGSCWAAGVTPGHAPVTAMTYFDHTATVCSLSE